MAHFTEQDAIEAARAIGFSLADTKIEPRALVAGMREEMEHGGPGVDPRLNITNGDPTISARIAMAHLFERPDYYDVLESAMDPHSMIVNMSSIFGLAIIILFIVLFVYLCVKYGGISRKDKEPVIGANTNPMNESPSA